MHLHIVLNHYYWFIVSYDPANKQKHYKKQKHFI